MALFVVTKEMLKTMDEAGDKFAGQETMATRWSRNVAFKAVVMGTIAIIVAILLPY